MADNPKLTAAAIDVMVDAPDIAAMSDEQLAIALIAKRFDAPAGHVEREWRAYGSDLHSSALRMARYVRTLIPPAPMPVARVPVAMASHDGFLSIACNDGTVWWLDDPGGVWVADAPIPQPIAATLTQFGTGGSGIHISDRPHPEAQDRDRVERQMADNQAAAERALHDHDPVREAAPELLAALKNALGVMDRYNGHHEVKNRVADVIAKAENRT